MPQEGALFPHLTSRATSASGCSRRERRGADVSRAAGDGRHRIARASACPTSSPAASSSASPWRGRWRCGPRRCCWTSPSPRWTPSCGRRCARRSTDLLRQQGVTTVLVTHDQEEALSLADTSRCCGRGGSSSRARRPSSTSAPADARLAGFLGEVNLIDAEFEEGHGRPRWASWLLAQDAVEGSGARGVVMVRPEQLEVTVPARAESSPRLARASRPRRGVPLLRPRRACSRSVPRRPARCGSCWHVCTASRRCRSAPRCTSPLTGPSRRSTDGDSVNTPGPGRADL